MRSSFVTSCSIPTVTLTLPPKLLSANCTPVGRYFLTLTTAVIFSVRSSTLSAGSDTTIFEILSRTLLLPAIVTVSGMLNGSPLKTYPGAGSSGTTKLSGTILVARIVTATFTVVIFILIALFLISLFSAL